MKLKLFGGPADGVVVDCHYTMRTGESYFVKTSGPIDAQYRVDERTTDQLRDGDNATAHFIPEITAAL